MPVKTMAGGLRRGKLLDLEIWQIVSDRKYQCRADGLDADHAQDLAEVLAPPETAGSKRPGTLERVRCYCFGDPLKGDPCYVVDGHHTFEAYRRARRKTVPCNVFSGTEEDAVCAAALGNLTKGHLALKPGRGDKRRRIEMVLGVHPEWTDGRVAKFLGVVSEEYVRRVRAETAPAEARDPTVGSRPAARQGSDGRTYARERKVKFEEAPDRDTALSRLDLPEEVRKECLRLGVRTAGRLADMARSGETLGLDDDSHEGLLEMLQMVPEARKDQPRNGAEAFAWRMLEEPMGRLTRLVDAAADAGPGRHTPDHAGCARLLAEFKKAVEGWKARWQPKKETA